METNKMISEKLAEHIRQSKIAAEANKAKGNRHVEILSSMYTDPAHCIDEIIQNTEDACRKDSLVENGTLEFRLSQFALHIFHDGLPFDEDDLIAITTIGQTTKKGLAGINLIGKFGLGFKSVFAVSDEPQIHSGGFHFRIRDFEILEQIDSVNTGNFTSLIILPFKKNIPAYQIIETALLSLSYQHLLFTQKLHKISVQTPVSQFELTKSFSKIISPEISEITIENSTFTETSKTFFLITNSSFSKANSISVGLQYESDGDTNITYHPLPLQPPYVFLPTLGDASLPFALNAPFTTTPTREQIPFDVAKTPENNAILLEIERFFRKLPLTLKKHKLLNETFLQLILSMQSSTNKANSPVSNAVFLGLSCSLQNDSVVPSASGKLYSASDLVCCESIDIASLIRSTDIRKFFGRKDMLHPHLLKYFNLSEVGRLIPSALKHIDGKDLAYTIGLHPELAIKKNTNWHSQFLMWVSAHHELWSLEKIDSWFSIREKPFILLNNNTLGRPWNADKVQIFLYSEKTRNVPMVHREFMKNPIIVAFFRELGIPPPDDVAEFRKHILPHLSDSKTSKIRRYKLWVQLFHLSTHATTELKNEISSALSSVDCFPATNVFSGKDELRPPCEVYENNEIVKQFFLNKSVFVVNSEFYSFLQAEGLSAAEIVGFFQQLGIKQQPAFVPFHPEDIPDEIISVEKTITESGLTVIKKTIIDYTIEGLDDFFSAPDMKRSVLLTQILSGNLPNGFALLETYTRQFKEYFEPLFLKQLRMQQWLFDDKGNIQSPKEIKKLHPDYTDNCIKPAILRELMGSEQLMQLNPNEEQFINLLRNSKNDPQSFISMITGHIVNTEKITIPLQETDPIIIETQNPQQFSSDEFVNVQISFPAFTENTHPITHPQQSSEQLMLKQLPAHKRAVEIVHLILQKKYHTSIQHDSLQADLIITDQQGVNHNVYVSSLKNQWGSFIFCNPGIHLINTDTIHFFGVDNVNEKRPVVYRFSKISEEKQVYPFVFLKPG